MIRLPILIATALVLSLDWTSTANASEIYQWIDEDGVVHFSDARPEDDAVLTTLRVRDTNPPDYDPVEDPYSIRNQARRTNEVWTGLKTEREERQEKRREEVERKLRATPPLYDPYSYYPRPTYFASFHPGNHRHHNPRIARKQLRALEELGLQGPRPHSINSGAHHARVLRSRNLPIVLPKPGPH